MTFSRRLRPAARAIPFDRSTAATPLSFLGLGLILCAGCGEPSVIQTYETPATEPRRQVVDVAEVEAGTDHMLAAIVA